MSSWPYGTVVRLSDRMLLQHSTATLADERAKSRVMVVADRNVASFVGTVVAASDHHAEGACQGNWTRSSWVSVDEDS